MQFHCNVYEAEIAQSAVHPANRCSVLVSVIFFVYSLKYSGRFWGPTNRYVQGNLSSGVKPSERDTDRLLVHLVPRLKMRGVVRALRHYISVACAEVLCIRLLLVQTF